MSATHNNIQIFGFSKICKNETFYSSDVALSQLCLGPFHENRPTIWIPRKSLELWNECESTQIIAWETSEFLCFHLNFFYLSI